nr:hypothetical protein [Tanacetum cinerariifolium]
MVIQNQSELGTDEAVHKGLGDRLVRAAIAASRLEAELDNGNINKTKSKATHNESSSQGTNSGGGPRVLDLEKRKTTQCNEIDSLKKRVKKLEKRNRSRTHKLKRLYKERRIDAIDADEDITLVNDADNEMFDVDDLGGEEVFVVGQNKNVVEEIVDAAQVSTAAATVRITTKEITLA